MSATSTAPVFTPVSGDQSFGGIVRSEWIKLFSVRSTWWTYAILVVVAIGLGALLSSTLRFVGVEGEPTQDAVQDLGVYALMASNDFLVLIVSILGVRTIAGEYGNRMIQTTLTAVPTRLPVLVAKALVLSVATALISGVAFAVSVVISVGLLAGNGIDVRVDDPQYLLAIAGGVGYLVLAGLIALAIGAILRNTAGGTAVAIALFLVAPIAANIVLQFVEGEWAQNLGSLLPSTAGSVLASYPTDQSWVNLAAPEDAGWVTEPWQGGLVLIAWAAVLLTAAAAQLKRRDA